MADLTAQDMANKLLADGFSRAGPGDQTLSDPVADTPMVVTLDELRPYELDPRVTRNPLYAEIKDSIRERGLDAPPPITRRPGADHYIIRNGGNTRLAILRDLWSETRDERFFRLTCMFRPWPARGEIVALTGHLAENELHGGLTFIERALGVEKARELYEEECDAKPLSQSELARRLAADGYPVQQSHISRMQDTVRFLLPAIPNILYAGLGRHQAERLAVLRRSCELVWETHAVGKRLAVDFATLFQDVLCTFDTQAEAFSVPRVQDELLGQMANVLDADYTALELDIVSIDNRQRAVLSPPRSPAEPPRSTPAPLPALGPTALPTASPAPPEAARAVPSPDGASARSLHGATPPPDTVPQTAPTTTPASDAAQADMDARLQGHIVSPAPTSERVHAIQQLVAEHTGEAVQDFATNVLQAIPVQVGGLYPITDVWYIDPGLDAHDHLRIHIAQFAREIAAEANLAEYVEPIDTGIGFMCPASAPQASPLSGLGRAVLALLHSLSVGYGPEMSSPSGPERSQLDIDLGPLLQGQPHGRANGVDRLSDNSLVKLFRMLRLARRLLELDSGTDESPEP
ncbi:ParB family protein [Achromobacter pestifer]|uniref:ParB N-terminal domain-containing protein n=1 Tax=Achromobacter pestifer TaxID=1353889 RepID=A0A6S6YVF8_9BURK|nr:ParB family protein [Achromobacter pestifer]CAB3648408.1 hypothetical protein LMG3431_02657 [Achromobacter pestifer]